MTNDIRLIRNFTIIAHIDHGKSTLADRLIEYCNALDTREMKNQVLDSMDIERERGITIKAQTVRFQYVSDNNKVYQLNLIDTPGHVDFAYEVKRSLSACESSLLVIDSTQGIQAQTLANVYDAIEAGHEILPVINKIDLPASNPDKVKLEIEEIIGINSQNSVLISAKSGLGIKNLLESIIKLPSPQGAINNYLKALLIDSWYDKYLGVIILIRVIEGKLIPGMKIRIINANKIYYVEQVGYFTPKKKICNAIYTGEIGFFSASIKQIEEYIIGDTIVDIQSNNHVNVKSIKSTLPVVFCGLYPTDASEFEYAKKALSKLQLNDSSFTFEIESSEALGFGFRCGFLGLLHLEIIQERLKREFNLDIITTSANVTYNIYTKNDKLIKVHNPAEFIEQQNIKFIEEPWALINIISPHEYLGNILNLCTEKRGIQEDITYSSNRVLIKYQIPLNEIMYDFQDKLKSCSKGYASFDWKFAEYKKSDVVKLTILLNNNIVHELSAIVHKTKAEKYGRILCKTLKESIPKQLFQISVQASVNNKIIVRENISALRKDVLAKCYGGDITRKRKLLEKQKAGKKKMRNIGNIEVPKEAFIEVLKINKD